MFRFGLMLAAVVAAFGLAGAEAAPLEAYGRLPNIEDVAIAPDGQKLAVIWTDGVERRVVVRDLTDGKLTQFSAGSAKIRSLDWAGSGHLLITNSTTTSIPWLSGPRSEWLTLFDYDLERQKLQPLMKDVANSMNVIVGAPVVREIAGKTTVLVEGVYFPGSQGVDSLFQIDLAHGSAKLVREGLPSTDDWVVGVDGAPVAQTTYDQKSGVWSLKIHTASQWRTVKTVTALQERPWLMGLGRDAGSVIVAEPDEDGASLHEISLADPVWGEPFRKQSSAEAIHDPAAHTLIGFHELRGDEQVYEFLKPEDAAAWAKIVRAYKGSQVTLVSWSADRSRVVVRIDPPDDGPSYALADLKARRADPIGVLYEPIRPADVSKVQPVRFKAADGLDLSGYLTLPNGRPAQKLPLVVLPHGGPAVRDEPGFDWWAQALASRGYAVLQVNYRGSAGFGGKFLEAGYGEWGRKMQTDLSDGVRYLASQGTIDPARVCIAGASYGGYAALAGAVFDSQVYRCAASVSGPSDLTAMVGGVKGRRQYAAMRYWTRFMGAEDAKDPVLRDISPAQHADRVHVPVLLVHGKDDTVVPLSQSQTMLKALTAAGKDVQMVTLEGEDHWLSRGETRQQMLSAIVAFLEKNNPPN